MLDTYQKCLAVLLPPSCALDGHFFEFFALGTGFAWNTDTCLTCRTRHGCSARQCESVPVAVSAVIAARTRVFSSYIKKKFGCWCCWCVLVMWCLSLLILVMITSIICRSQCWWGVFFCLSVFMSVCLSFFTLVKNTTEGVVFKILIMSYPNYSWMLIKVLSIMLVT